jgi:tetratricopeptide (TPR) repeat protein
VGVGPPQALEVPGNWDYAGMTFDRRGRWLAVTDFPRSRAIVLDLDNPSHKLVLQHRGMAGTALSPDGRWVMTWTPGNVPERITKVWDTSNGQCVWEAPAGEIVDFLSPDSRWLVTSSPGAAPLHFWQLGSWQPGPTLPKHSPKLGAVWPSPDGRLLAANCENLPPQLLDAATGKPLATLEAPLDPQIYEARFSPDGTKLASGTGNHTLHIWDLPAIRRGLAEIGLDWDLPAYPPAPKAEDVKPLQLHVDLGELVDREKYSLILAFFPFHAEGYYRRGLAYTRFNQWQKAFADFNMAVALEPDHPEYLYQRGFLHLQFGQWEKAEADFSKALEGKPNKDKPGPDELLMRSNRAIANSNLGAWPKVQADYAKILELKPDLPVSQNTLAWFLATCPEAKLRDPIRAVELAKKAVERAPKEGNHWNTLGVAQYRAGDWKAAIEALTRSQELLGDNELSFNAFFLAMAHWKLGSKQEAHDWYAKAIGWMEKSKPKDEELLRFRAEAEELLRINHKDTEHPKEKLSQ